MPNTKKTSGANVEKYMLRTEELRKATEHVGEEIQQQGLGDRFNSFAKGSVVKDGAGAMVPSRGSPCSTLRCTIGLRKALLLTRSIYSVKLL